MSRLDEAFKTRGLEQDNIVLKREIQKIRSLLNENGFSGDTPYDAVKEVVKDLKKIDKTLVEFGFFTAPSTNFSFAYTSTGVMFALTVQKRQIEWLTEQALDKNEDI